MATTKSSQGSHLPYQLISPQQLAPGAYVGVNGPWDSHGVVTSSAPYEKSGFLNQVRGCAKKPGMKTVFEF